MSLNFENLAEERLYQLAQARFDIAEGEHTQARCAHTSAVTILQVLEDIKQIAKAAFMADFADNEHGQAQAQAYLDALDDEIADRVVRRAQDPRGQAGINAACGRFTNDFHDATCAQRYLDAYLTHGQGLWVVLLNEREMNACHQAEIEARAQLDGAIQARDAARQQVNNARADDDLQAIIAAENGDDSD